MTYYKVRDEYIHESELSAVIEDAERYWKEKAEDLELRMEQLENQVEAFFALEEARNRTSKEHV